MPLWQWSFILMWILQLDIDQLYCLVKKSSKNENGIERDISKNIKWRLSCFFIYLE